MKPRWNIIAIIGTALLWAVGAQAQDLGPGFHKINDGIYTFAPDQSTTTCSFVVSEAGVVMIDACNSPLDSRRMAAAIKKVTDKPIMFLIDTETHSDHTANHFIFSPPATVINAEGAGAGMKKEYNPKRAETLAAKSPEMREALKGEKWMGEMAAQGKSLEEIKKELKMPEYANWLGQDRLPANIEAAWKSVKK
jgi:glyoxylase-like metal-dependent hydrolase (beta-lactamase superfamily II)